MAMQLRHYQTAAVNAVIAYLKAKPGMPLISAATGTGKSLIIAGLIKRLLSANPEIHVMIVTHAAELIVQNEAKLRAIWPDAPTAIYSASVGRKQFNKITFGGIQSLWRQKIELPINLLIVDEAHTISRKEKSMWGNFIDMLRTVNPKLRIIGLSATTYRMDSGNLTSGDDAMFDDIVFDYGLKTAIDDGWLTPLTAKYTKTTYDISKVGKLGGEFNIKELEAATNLDNKNQEAVAEIIEAGKNRRSWLTFCNGVAHSFSVRDEFRRMGVTCETITGETPWDLRESILSDHRSGKTQCLTNNAVLTTGVDLPDVDLIAMMRHTMSGGLLVQMAGRGTRAVIDLSPYPDAPTRQAAIQASPKPNCAFLDFSRNIERHGFLDEIRGKDKGEKGTGVAPMKDCPQCHTICHAAATQCPDCGYTFITEKKGVVGSVYKGALFSSGDKPDEREVIGVTYMGWNMKKEEKKPTLCVIYKHPDGSSTKEWVCLQHEGYPGQKAAAWWIKRSHKASYDNISDLGIGMIVDGGYCDKLLVPGKIIVRKEGKYERIAGYGKMVQPDLRRAASSNILAEMDDIEF